MNHSRLAVYLPSFPSSLKKIMLAPMTVSAPESGGNCTASSHGRWRSPVFILSSFGLPNRLEPMKYLVDRVCLPRAVARANVALSTFV